MVDDTCDMILRDAFESACQFVVIYKYPTHIVRCDSAVGQIIESKKTAWLNSSVLTDGGELEPEAYAASGNVQKRYIDG